MKWRGFKERLNAASPGGAARRFFLLGLILFFAACGRDHHQGGSFCLDLDGDGRGQNCALEPDCNDLNPSVWTHCHAPQCLDLDGDGYGLGCALGPDCNDGDTTIYAGAREIYGDGIDQDCDGRDPDQFVIDPHLQLGNQPGMGELKDRITVVWQTSLLTGATVLYGTTFPPTNAVTDASAARHEVDLTGLSPDTRYFYQVLAGDSAGPVTTFRTAPTDLHQPFTFAYIGDTRTQHAIHQSVVDLAAKWKPAFVVHGGDMVEDGGDPSLWEIYFPIERPLLQFAAIAPIAGNHDWNLWPDYFATPLNFGVDESRYSWDYGNIHFIGLNTDYPDAAQDALLSADLAAAAANYPSTRFIIAVMHRNLYTNGGHPGDENYAYSTIWGPLFESAQVAIVLQAHCHLYERFEPIDNRAGLGDPPGNPDVIRQGVTYVTGGGGGAPLAAVLPVPGAGGGGTPPLNSLVAESTYEAMKLQVSGGKMHVRVYRAADGSLLDEFYVIRNQAPIADAGTDFSASLGTRVVLDGSASSDPEDDPLDYHWTQTGGPPVNLKKSKSVSPAFVPLRKGAYAFQLEASDGIDKDTDQVTVTVN